MARERSHGPAGPQGCDRSERQSERIDQQMAFASREQNSASAVVVLANVHTLQALSSSSSRASVSLVMARCAIGEESTMDVLEVP